MILIKAYYIWKESQIKFSAHVDTVDDDNVRNYFTNQEAYERERQTRIPTPPKIISIMKKNENDPNLPATYHVLVLERALEKSVERIIIDELIEVGENIEQCQLTLIKWNQSESKKVVAFNKRISEIDNPSNVIIGISLGLSIISAILIYLNI